MSASQADEREGEEALEERCRLAVDAVLDVAAEHCETEEQVLDRITRMLGVEPDIDCNAALSEGLNRETCDSTKGLKQWVACRAQQLRRAEDIGLGTAMEQAWAEAKEECLTVGVEV